MATNVTPGDRRLRICLDRYGEIVHFGGEPPVPKEHFQNRSLQGTLKKLISLNVLENINQTNSKEIWLSIGDDYYKLSTNDPHGRICIEFDMEGTVLNVQIGGAPILSTTSAGLVHLTWIGGCTLAIFADATLSEAGEHDRGRHPQLPHCIVIKLPNGGYMTWCPP